MSNVYIISDTHLKHEKMRTYCDRPENFTELVHRNIMNTVRDDDMVIHLGDVGIHKASDWEWMIHQWPGKWTLIRGNHDESHTATWWLEHGFDSVNDGHDFSRRVDHAPPVFNPARWVQLEPARASA